MATFNHFILIDVSYLCHRAFHTTGGLRYDGFATGVLFGVFRDILTLRERLQGLPIFCFDLEATCRHSLLPCYKESRVKRRETLTDDERRVYREFSGQIEALRTRHLREMGFANVFSARGYEADDVIASVALSIPDGSRATIVSADSDLWQLVRTGRIRCYNPTHGSFVTEEHIKHHYGLSPDDWIKVKAITGDSTDDIPGVKGVGIATATRYVNGSLKKGKKYDDIVAAEPLWQKNIKLIRLPFEGCPSFTIGPDSCTDERWNEVASKLGMSSLMLGRAGKAKERR